jgi:hypothetical protein
LQEDNTSYRSIIAMDQANLLDRPSANGMHAMEFETTNY